VGIRTCDADLTEPSSAGSLLVIVSFDGGTCSKTFVKASG